MMLPELGVCLAAYADLDFGQAVGAAAKAGATLVDLPTDSVFAMTRTLPTAPGVTLDCFADAGLRVVSISNSRDTQLLLGPHGPHTDGVHRGSASAKVAHARESAMAAIDLAAAIGAPQVRLMLGCPDFARWLYWPRSTVSWSENVEAFAKEAVPLANRAAAVGVELCVEPHIKQVAFDAESWLACRDRVEASGEHLGLCFDPANIAALGFDPVAALAMLNVVPSCVHAKDVERATTVRTPDEPGWVRYGPQPALRFRAIPWGGLDWPRILTALHEIGFGGPLEDVPLAVEVAAGGGPCCHAALFS